MQAVAIAPSNISELDVQSLWHPLTQHKPLAQNPPAHMVKGEGSYLTDANGKEYLDAVAGIWCVNVGYGRKELGRCGPRTDHEPGLPVADHDP